MFQTLSNKWIVVCSSFWLSYARQRNYSVFDKRIAYSINDRNCTIEYSPSCQFTREAFFRSVTIGVYNFLVFWREKQRTPESPGSRVNLRRQVGKLNGSTGHPFQLGGTCECFITETVQHIPRSYLRGQTEEASFNLPVEITNSVHESQPMSTPSLFPRHYDSHIIRRTYTSSYIEPDIPVETLVKTIRRELPW